MIPGLTISSDASLLNYDWLIGTLLDSYWGDHLTKAKIIKAIDHSLCFGAYIDDSKLQIGFARVVTDRAIFSSITDIIVETDFRGMGCGSALMQAVVSHPHVAPTICILETRTVGFYDRFGFMPHGAGIMKRNPTP